MKRLSLAVLGTLLASLLHIGVANAVTDGAPDGAAHPYVGLLVFDVGGRPAWRCSGTLLSPTILLTAGHCTSGTSGGRVWFESDAQHLVGYPFDGPTSYKFCDIATHQDFTDAAFYLHDVGIVHLCDPVPASVTTTYGTLPAADLLDGLKTQRGKQDVTFTAVGYGLQKSFPDATSYKDSALKIRMVAHPQLNAINSPGSTGDFSLLLSNNANTGGTCFGDSGGPNFLGTSNLVAGVTSYGKNGTCAGTGGVFRMDRQNVLDFINDFIALFP